MRIFSILMTMIMLALASACAATPGEKAATMAYDSYAQGHYSHSLPAAQVLIAEEPDAPLGYIIAGDSLVRLKRYDEAAVYYEALLKLLERQPDPPAVRAEAAATAFKLERVHEHRSWTRKELREATTQRLRAPVEGRPDSSNGDKAEPQAQE